jgi:hypothetical protein
VTETAGIETIIGVVVRTHDGEAASRNTTTSKEQTSVKEGDSG